MLRAINQRLSGRSRREVAALVAKNIRHVVRGLSPAAVMARRRDRAFDRRWGTETSRLANLSSLAVDQARARHGVRYQPSTGDALSRVVAAFGIDPARYTFVDYGCGKGRICMLAARMGFADVIGVEFAPELCAIAEQNIAAFVAAGGTPVPPTIILGDAGAFAPPAGPMFAYLYNPFGAPVLDEVVANLAGNAAAGVPVVVCYVEPQHMDAFAGWTVVLHASDVALLKAPIAS